MKYLLSIIVSLSVCASMAYGATKQSEAVGLWYTAPSKNGNVDVVEIFEHNGKLYGYGLSNKDPSKNTVRYDVRNPNPVLRHQQLTGLIIIYDVEPTEKKNIRKGYIYDPDNGKTYYLYLTIKNANTLILKPTLDERGVIGPRIEWTRVNDPHMYTPLRRSELHTPYVK